jgi:hypothetical protein
MRSHVRFGRSVVTGSRLARSPTSHGITLSLLRRPWFAAYEEGFPVISRFVSVRNYFRTGQLNYPTRNFATLGRL